MPFSLKVIQSPYLSKDGGKLLYIQIICNRIKMYVSTGIKVTQDQFASEMIIKHANKDSYNLLLQKKKNDLESKLIKMSLHHTKITKQLLDEIIKGNLPANKNLKFVDFIYSIIDESGNKISHGRIKHYRSLVNKILYFNDNVQLIDINAKWLQSFETFLFEHQLAQNTVNANMKLIKSFIHKADERGLTDSRLMKGYKMPKYVQPEIEYLTEQEMNNFYDLVKTIKKDGHQLAGYYFMLSCLTGLRISDAKRFDYNKMVVDDTVILRAQKNKKMVSIPVYPQLKEVLEFIKDNPFSLSEQKANEYIKDIASLVGIKKRIYYHISRHTAASRFLQKGFSIKEVAYIIADSRLVTEIYAHLDNSHMKKRFQELMS